MRGAHRRVPTPPYKAIREIDGQLFTVCRWCDVVITKPNGSPDRRRNWHPDCVTVYLIRSDARFLRQRVFERDRGLCAGCGFWVAMPIDRHQKLGYDYIQAFNIGKAWYLTLPWQADHIIPLIDGGSFDLSNVQTLCDSCHKAKTGREATERAARRRPIIPLPLFEQQQT